MKIFDYCFIDARNKADLLTFLKLHGNEGWELVSCFFMDQHWFAIMKMKNEITPNTGPK